MSRARGTENLVGWGLETYDIYWVFFWRAVRFQDARPYAAVVLFATASDH